MKMIYPLDIYKRTQTAGKMSSEEKLKFGVTLLGIGFVVVQVVLHYLCKVVFLIPSWIGAVVGVVLSALVFYKIFTIFIFNEEEKMQEYEGQDIDSFARYVYIRKESDFTLKAQKLSITGYEYVNGNRFCVMQFRFGSNTKEKSIITKAVLQQIFHVITEAGLVYRTVDTKENFEDSTECDTYIKRLNNIADKKLAKHLLQVADKALSETRTLSNVATLYITVQTTSAMQAADLDMVIGRIITLVNTNKTAFRSLNFLDKEQLLEFYREFYGLEVLDLSVMRAIALAEDSVMEYANIVSVYRLESTTGKMYTSQDKLLPYFKTEGRKIR